MKPKKAQEPERNEYDSNSSKHVDYFIVTNNIAYTLSHHIVPCMPKSYPDVIMWGMKKEYRSVITIVAVVIVLGLVVWGVSSTRKTVRETIPSDTDKTQTTGTTTPAAPTSTTTLSSPGVTVTNVKVTGDANSEAYFDPKFLYVLAYPRIAALPITPSPETTPLAYRTDREFAYCIKELQTTKGCAPAFMLGLPDKSGHGVSVYILDNAKVQAIWPQDKNLQNIFIDTKNNRRFEIYYSDTVSVQATGQQNTDRQKLMARMVESFSFVE